MRRGILSIILSLWAGAALGQSTIDGLPAVPTFPLPDPATTTQNELITQGGNTYRASPTQLGYIFQGTTAPTNPFVNQLWWDTSSGGGNARLRYWNGTNWVTITNAGAVNVRNFGVNPDGTDVTAALQTAVNSVAGGSCLYFPSGGVSSPGYALSAVVTLPAPGMCFLGDFGGTRIFELASNTTGLFKAAANAVIQMTNINLDGNRASGATGDCFYTDTAVGVQGLTFDHVTGQNCAGNAITLDGTGQASANVQIHDGLFQNNGNAIIGRSLRHFNFANNLIRNNLGTGIGCFTTACVEGTIGGNILISNGGDNISGQIETNSDILITGNYSENAGGDGIQMGGTRISIIGNHVLAPTNFGILAVSVRKYSTGTISVVNGSATVSGTGTAWTAVCPDIQMGFVSNTGTRLQTSVSPGNSPHGGGTTNGVQIKSIDSNNSMTLSAVWSGSTLNNITYTIFCPLSIVSPVISANTIQGLPGGGTGIFVAKPQGGVISSNSIDDATGQVGIRVTGDTFGYGLTVVGNTVSQKSGNGIRVDADSVYTTGTVAVTNGSPTVTLSGASFNDIPVVTWFRAASDTTAYQVSSQTGSTLTLNSNYLGSTLSGLTYTAAGGVSQGTNLSANVSRANAGAGIALANCVQCAVSGGVYNTNIVASVNEFGVSNHNILSGFVGGTVTLIDATTQALHNGNATSLKLTNLPTTPGSKQPVCIDTATNIVYKGSAGAC